MVETHWRDFLLSQWREKFATALWLMHIDGVRWGMGKPERRGFMYLSGESKN